MKCVSFNSYLTGRVLRFHVIVQFLSPEIQVLKFISISTTIFYLRSACGFNFVVHNIGLTQNPQVRNHEGFKFSLFHKVGDCRARAVPQACRLGLAYEIGK